VRCEDRWLLWLACAAAAACMPTAARAEADGCGGVEVDRDELVTFPDDRARAVALDALITLRYPADTDLDALRRTVAADAASDVCGGALACLFSGSAREPVAARSSADAGTTLVLVPDALLLPETDYYVSIARPGFDRASRVELQFTTDAEPDREPPRLAADASALRLTVEPAPPECEVEPGSLRVRLLVPRVRDDSDEQSVELLAFLSRARGLRAPVLRARARNPESGDVLLGFVLDPDQASEPVCVVLRAVDGTGKRSEAEPELCFDPREGSHFVPLCSAQPRAVRADGAARTLVTSCALLLLRSRARRRRGPTRGAHA
jgi:hypothetical protein